MSLLIKTAVSVPVRIDIDQDTDAGRIKGHFTGHARIFSPDELQSFSEWTIRLSRHITALKADEPVPTVDDEFAGITAQNADENLLRRMYLRFEGLADGNGPVEGDEAFRQVCTGPLSFFLYRAASDAFWAYVRDRKAAREGNARPSPAR